jgi:4-hydroxy-3-polyprenylbenzoate decarboxylase
MGVVSQFPPSESSMIKKVLLEAGLIRHLTETLNIPGIADVHVLEAGGGTAVLWVSLRKTYTGQVDQVMFGALGHFGTSYFKWLVVTDDDVDIRDPFMRDWILSWRVQPDRDLRIIPNSGAVELDPSVHPPEVILKERLGAKVLIDATKKFEYPAISLPPMQFLQRVYANWSDYGLPALDTLRLPKGL